MKYAPDRVSFRYVPYVGSTGKDLEVKLHVAGEADGFSPDTVLFTGLGNEGRAVSLGARRMGENGIKGLVVVEGLPYLDSEPTEVGITNFVVQASTAVADHVREKYESTDALHIIGESQAAPGVLEVAADNPDAFDGRLALLRPLGLNHLKKWIFVRRMLRTAGQVDQLTDPRVSMRVGGNASRQVLQDMIEDGGRLKFALEYAGNRLLHELSDREIAIFTAERDKVFPTDEINETLDENGITHVPVYEVKGSHTSPATKRGVQQVSWVVEWCQTGEIEERPVA